ncbi:MAG TPA: hypothetical protein DCR27_05055 [Lachnospiraceae bacterium]|nr:hypothetical protein [Lachnospiraceae bacterium]
MKKILIVLLILLLALTVLGVTGVFLSRHFVTNQIMDWGGMELTDEGAHREMIEFRQRSTE